MTTKTKPAATAAPKAEAVVNVGDIDIALPPKPTRAGTGRGKYPFADLDVNKFFSVTGKDRRGMATAIANANKRYRKEIPAVGDTPAQVIQDREFYAVDVDAELAKALSGSPHEGATVLVIRSK